MTKQEEKEMAKLKRMYGYLLNALDVLEANECFSSNKAMRQYLGIESREDAKELELL